VPSVKRVRAARMACAPISDARRQGGGVTATYFLASCSRSRLAGTLTVEFGYRVCPYAAAGWIARARLLAFLALGALIELQGLGPAHRHVRLVLELRVDRLGRRADVDPRDPLSVFMILIVTGRPRR